MEFLLKRGHTPFKALGNGRYSFLCPFPDHKESMPSFVVYTNGPYENFYCFGCCKNYNIINLVSYLDNISFKEAIEKLGDGTVISTDEDIKITLKRLKTENNSIHKDISKILIEISMKCLMFCQGVNFDKDEINVIDQYYKFIDDSILGTDICRIEESRMHLNKLLIKRKKEYDKRRREFLVDSI
jgi:DNA primase